MHQKTPKAKPLPKIPKDPLKIRLIINTQNSPIYKIVKQISKELLLLVWSGKSYIKGNENLLIKSTCQVFTWYI